MSSLPDTKAEVIDEVQEVLAYHGEDPKAAIESLLADVRHLSHLLALAEAAMSSGFTKGWRPNVEQ